MIRIEEFILSSYGCSGRRPEDRVAIARAFVAKTVYNMSTTRALLDRLETDISLRRICGWERKNDISAEWTFSRAFAEFSESQLPERIHFYIFDEWAADQDPEFKELFYTELLPALTAKGKTVLAITHDDRYFHLADRCIKMEEGQIISIQCPVKG